MPQGEPGEICVAGPLLAGGYWKLPEQTAETFRDGWMHTGDVAREDEDGFWYIVDRTKDMIVTGGFNVFPREVEDVVAEHPMVAQVGVIGTPHEKFGEAVTAIVVLRPDAESDDDAIARMTEEIQAAVKERKGSVHVPKDVIVADALPADRARQAGQEGAARPVLGGPGPHRRLSGSYEAPGGGGSNRDHTLGGISSGIRTASAKRSSSMAGSRKSTSG